MPEIIIKYKKTKIDVVKIIKENDNIDIFGLNEIFTNANLDAKQLREKAWQ